jgi:thioredoxin-like negative regulator of GroEL
MDTVVFPNEKVTAFFSKQMMLVKLNAEVDTTIAREMGVSAFPTLVLLNSKGEEIDRIVGYLDADPFLKTLDEYQHGIGTLADLLNKSKSDTSRDLAFQIGDKYKYRGKSVDAVVWYKKVIATGQPTDSLSGESRMAVADMLRRDKKWDEALAEFAAIEKDFTGSSFAFSADAGIWQGITLARKGDTTAAISAYEAFLKNHPNVEDTSYARKQIEKLKNPPKVEKK